MFAISSPCGILPSGMTIEGTTTVSLDEIKALEIRCNKCGGFLSVPIERTTPVPLDCPGCGEELTKGTTHTPSIVFVQLVRQLRDWANIEQQAKDFQITFTLYSQQDD